MMRPSVGAGDDIGFPFRARDFKGLDKKKEGDPTENLGPIRDRPYPRMELKPRMVPSLIEQRW